MGFKEVIIWLGIFIVGSLIVFFILDPSSSNNLKNNVVNTIESISQKQTQINYSDYVKTWNDYVYCSDIEYLARESGQSNKQAKDRACIALCSQTKNFNKETDGGYVTNACENGLLICYCSKAN